ncbi:FimV family protein [Orrella sp. 11846]|uniref:type IV pilus assembly protein FimV n=1 Tax=Orrella sp. 11846 TaxID=3409913 RepID=UPI003B5C8E58
MNKHNMVQALNKQKQAVLKQTTHGFKQTTVKRTLKWSLSLALAFGVSTSAAALEVGRAHLASQAGEPLLVMIPVRDLSPEDASALSVRIADAAQWTQAGLTPPADLNTIQVQIVPGQGRQTRFIELRAPSAPSSNVVDVLLDLQSATTSRRIQSSMIAPGFDQAQGVRTSGHVHNVMRGDTLFDIARQYGTPGADVYQTLWALYTLNPKAFLSNNMNLLKAGSSLSIPSANDVKQIDRQFARAQFQAHLKAFQSGRGRTATGTQVIPSQDQRAPVAQSTTGTVEAESQVQEAGAVRDKVRLTSADQSSPAHQANVQADQAVSASLERQELVDQVTELERNVAALKGALAAAGLADPTTSTTKGQAQAGANNLSAAGDSSAVGASASTSAGGASTSSGAADASLSSNASSSTNTPSSSFASASASTSGQTGVEGVGAEGAKTGDASGQALADASSTGTTSSGTSSADSASASASASSSEPSKADGAKPASEGTSGRALADAAPDSNASTTAQQSASDSPVEQVRQWVSDNMLATGALILALLALLFAAATRSKAARQAQPEQDVAQAKAFEEKLSQINLDLDEPQDPDTQAKADQKPS